MGAKNTQVQKATGQMHNRYISQGLLGVKSQFLAQKVLKLKIAGVWESISGKYHYVLSYSAADFKASIIGCFWRQNAWLSVFFSVMC